MRQWSELQDTSGLGTADTATTSNGKISPSIAQQQLWKLWWHIESTYQQQGVSILRSWELEYQNKQHINARNNDKHFL